MACISKSARGGIMAAGLLFLFAASPTDASIIYEYQGLNFTTIVNATPPDGDTFDESMSVSGTVELDLPFNTVLAAFTPLFFSISIGPVTFTDQDTLLIVAFNFATVDGVITSWSMLLTDVALVVGTQQFSMVSNSAGDTSRLRECLPFGPIPCFGFALDLGSSSFAGTWTQVPEPHTLAIFVLGLAGLGIMMRRRRTGVGRTTHVS